MGVTTHSRGSPDPLKWFRDSLQRLRPWLASIGIGSGHLILRFNGDAPETLDEHTRASMTMLSTAALVAALARWSLKLALNSDRARCNEFLSSLCRSDTEKRYVLAFAIPGARATAQVCVEKGMACGDDLLASFKDSQWGHRLRRQLNLTIGSWVPLASVMIVVCSWGKASLQLFGNLVVAFASQYEDFWSWPDAPEPWMRAALSKTWALDPTIDIESTIHGYQERKHGAKHGVRATGQLAKYRLEARRY